MKHDLTTLLDVLANDVVVDWRWVPDDLSVSVLGMLLYGLALETGHAFGLHQQDIDTAVLHCLTERVGAAAKWSAGMLAEAHAAVRSRSHHPGHSDLIQTGRQYYGISDRIALRDNVYANFASIRQAQGLPDPVVPVFVTPLAWLLAAREKQKGSPLDKSEVLAVRDAAACTVMPLSQAERFYADLDARMPAPRLHPERLWEQWQSIREHINLQ